MLKELRIRHLILVEETEIHFHRNFNVVSGETGAGKSAIITALALLLGERAEGSVLRHGEERGSVEALFHCSGNQSLLTLLHEAGIEAEDGEVIIRREIRSNGKGRAFINTSAVPLHFLRAVGKLLIKFVTQHAGQELQALERHRELLDSYSGIEELLFSFKALWHREKQLDNELELLRSGETRRLRELEILQQEAKEIDEAALVEGEEESLFATYSKLNHAEELKQKKKQILFFLEGDAKSVLTLLRQAGRAFEEVVAIDPGLEEFRSSLLQAAAEIKEVAYVLNASQADDEADPYRLQEIDERLGLINKMKKRYGPTLEKVLAYRLEIGAKIDHLENADCRIDEISKELEELRRQTDELAQKISKERQKYAVVMATEVEDHLHKLNMPKARFSIALLQQARAAYGDDSVEFFIAPNVGEDAVSVRHCASGGEISRLMLALQALLAGKDQIPTLVFDEIDANVGGRTASYVGGKLCSIADQHQVICITHFPQVAQQAAHHLQICKEEIDGRTLTLVRSLDGKAREQELARMRGEV